MRTIPISKLKDYNRLKNEIIMPTQEEFYEDIVHEINRQVKMAINNNMPSVSLDISYGIFYGQFCHIETIDKVVKHFKDHGYNIVKESDVFEDSGNDKRLVISWNDKS